MNNNFVKGIMAGAIMGAVVGMMFDPIRSNKDTQHFKRKAGRVMKTAGSIIENLTDL